MTRRCIEMVRPVRQRLSAVGVHSDISGLTRHLYSSTLLSKRCPYHIAVHHFNRDFVAGKRGRFRYTSVHGHKCWEVIVHVPFSRSFVFQVESQGKVHVLKGRKTIVIPPGVTHRMEAIRGEGLMVCCVGDANCARSLLTAAPDVTLCCDGFRRK